jgi:hypothetical protein
MAYKSNYHAEKIKKQHNFFKLPLIPPLRRGRVRAGLGKFRSPPFDSLGRGKVWSLQKSFAGRCYNLMKSLKNDAYSFRNDKKVEKGEVLYFNLFPD